MSIEVDAYCHQLIECLKTLRKENIRFIGDFFATPGVNFSLPTNQNSMDGLSSIGRSTKTSGDRRQVMKSRKPYVVTGSGLYVYYMCITPQLFPYIIRPIDNAVLEPQNGVFSLPMRN